MRLTPREIEKLMLHQAGSLAQKRYARGIKLNYVEATALIASQILELIREGYAVSELMDLGKRFIGLNDVMPGVADMVDEVQVEGTFPDGTKLVTVHQPICRDNGEAELALYGSGLSRNITARTTQAQPNVKPGESFTGNEELELNVGRETLSIHVTNMGDRPVQVGSHYPFFETNASLKFDRDAAYGFRLNIPSGTAVRFEAGEKKSVELVKLAGEETVFGGNALISGAATPERKAQSLQQAIDNNFLHEEQNHDA